MLLVKYAAIALSTGLWAFGLIDQLHSVETATTYLLLSGAMLVVAFF